MKLSIIIPVFNEEKTIEKIIKKVEDLRIDGVEKDIIIVDDGSTDSTKDILKKYKKNRVFFHEYNKGKGKAVRTGIKNAQGDYIIIQDADLEYDPKYIESLLEPIRNGKSEVVYGTRLKRMPNIRREEKTLQFLLHYFGNRFLSLVTSILYGQWITDMETGYKIFPSKSVANIKLDARGFEFEPEITAKLLRKGNKILEIPIQTIPRGYDEGKKLNTIKDGLMAFWILLKYRFKQ